jgi:protein-S-isoprenylcysteine O-methyltransferase Ste14
MQQIICNFVFQASFKNVNTMAKLNFMGIGPKIAIVFLPWLTLSIVLSTYKKDLFVFTKSDHTIILYAGIFLMALGALLYFATAFMLLRGLKETRLMTRGAYGLCQNPLYSAIMLLIVPALAMIMNSWLVLTSSVAGYIMFRIYIKSEYAELEKFFGEEYQKYRKETPEFFPFPLKKWFHK